MGTPMKRCYTCNEQVPSHELLKSQCPFCRRIMASEMTEEEATAVWEDAEAYYSSWREEDADDWKGES